MNLFTIDYQSPALHKLTTVNVLFPNVCDRKTEIPSLMLLHGMTDNQGGWIRRSLAENYAEEMGLCLIIPNADLSFYTDMAYGGDYLTFLAKELPEFLQIYFPLSAQKEKRFVAGNSMGGYGAFLLAMRYPELFKAAFSLSGPMKIEWIYRILSDKRLIDFSDSQSEEYIKDIMEKEQIPEILIKNLMESGDMVRIFQSMFGEGVSLAGSDVDLMTLVKKKKFLEDPVKLIAYCGEQDYHYESNLLFKEAAKGLELSYSLTTGAGKHDWQYWNKQVQDMFGIIKEQL